MAELAAKTIKGYQKIKPYCHKWYEGWENMDLKPFYVMNSRE